MPIVEAAYKGDVSAIEFAMQMGEQVDTVSKDVRDKHIYGKTALMAACEAGKIAAVRYLIANGADVNKEDMENLKTPLHFAVDGYRNDLQGKIDIEDCVLEIVKKGGHAVPDRNGKLPDAGRNSSVAVDRALRNAEAKGRPLVPKIMAARKERGKAAFANAFQNLLDNASAATIVVCDSGDCEGYKYGGRGELPKF